MKSINQLLLESRTRFKEAGISSYQEDARLLICHALAWTKEKVFAYPSHLVTEAEQEAFESYVMRRLAREPVSRIMGVREFWSLPFKISPHTLDPRPDSETLIDAVLSSVDKSAKSLSVLDLGTGSGCLLLALLSELPQAFGWGIDQSKEALTVAQENATALSLESRSTFLMGNWGAGLARTFDVIISNPPYIPQADESVLERDVVDYDPSSALFAGEDGLDAYRVLMPDVKNLLAPKGKFFLEIGEGQEDAVSEIITQCDLEFVSQKRDIQKTVRCIIGQHKKRLISTRDSG